MFLKRSLTALAVTGVFGGASVAYAQTSTVQLYGRLNMGLDNYEASGARNQGFISGTSLDYASRMRVYDQSSRVGVRGSEDLGNGLKAIFQIESGVNVDTGTTTGQGGQSNSSTGTWGTRDSFVGLDSGFGRLTFGRQSIWYQNGELAQYQSNYINTEVPWTDGRGLGRMPTPASRTSNVVQYTSPTFFGLNGSAYYSPNAQEAVQQNSCVLPGQTPTTQPGPVTANTTCVTGTGQQADGYIAGATLRGNWGAFVSQVDYVYNRGNSPITTTGFTAAGAPLQIPTSSSTPLTQGLKAGLGWKYLPGALVSVVYVWARSNRVAGLAAGDTANQTGWTLNWEQTFGNIQAMAQYGILNALRDCDGGTLTIDCGDSKATAWMVGARYFMSKRTWIYASYNQTSNQQNQFVDYTSSGMTSVNNPAFVPYGADPRIYAVGVFHSF